MKEGAELADESNRIQAKLEAVITATGGAAGLSAQEINRMNDALMEQTGVDDELLNNASAVLLTFRNIGEDAFPLATKAALDMSAVMGGDLQGSIVMVGKALQDPISGVTALRRVGVQLSEEQERQIKNFIAQNDLASAQAVILDELTKEFGGAARAIHDAGNMSEDVDNAWENLYETVGQRAIPLQRAWNSAVVEAIDGWNRFLVLKEQHQRLDNLTAGILASQGLTMEQSTRLKRIDNSATEEQIALAQEQAVAMMLEEEGITSLSEATAAHTEIVNQEAEALNLVKAAIAGEFQDTWDNYTETLEGLQEQQQQYNDDLKVAEATYGTSSEQAEELRLKIEENAEAQRELKESTDDAVRSLIFQQVASRASAQTQLELGRAMGLISEADYAIASATEAIIDQGTPDFVDPEEVGQLQSLADNVLKLKGENIPITFDALISATIVDSDEVARMIAAQVAPLIAAQLNQNSTYNTLMAVK